MQICQCETDVVLLENVEVASTFLQRFRGMMFRKRFPPGYGLWIDPCRSIHTMWMRVPIDVYFIAADGTINEVRGKVKPWSVAIPKEKCQAVLEVPASELTLPVGKRIRLRE
jgi:uncharacterized membrane protein (UPF0127 family)